MTDHWQKQEARLRTLTPTANRITFALDHPAGGGPALEGPDVDTACGVTEPTVDMWESGAAVPTFDQVKLLAKLTGFPVAFFYEPPLKPITGIVCSSRPRRCETVTSDPDYRKGKTTGGQGALW